MNKTYADIVRGVKEEDEGVGSDRLKYLSELYSLSKIWFPTIISGIESNDPSWISKCHHFDQNDIQRFHFLNNNCLYDVDHNEPVRISKQDLVSKILEETEVRICPKHAVKAFMKLRVNKLVAADFENNPPPLLPIEIHPSLFAFLSVVRSLVPVNLRSYTILYDEKDQCYWYTMGHFDIPETIFSYHNFLLMLLKSSKINSTFCIYCFPNVAGIVSHSLHSNYPLVPANIPFCMRIEHIMQLVNNVGCAGMIELREVYSRDQKQYYALTDLLWEQSYLKYTEDVPMLMQDCTNVDRFEYSLMLNDVKILDKCDESIVA